MTEKQLNEIAIYMNSEIREKVHYELAPCTPDEFYTRYLELDKLFHSEYGEEIAQILEED